MPTSKKHTTAGSRTKSAATARDRRTAKPTATRPAKNSPADIVRPTRRAGTKQAKLLEMLCAKSGATIAELAQATGWQQHSVRGVISGTVKRKLDLEVASEVEVGRGRVYRIVGAPAEDA